ncbi:MAG: polysaccharide pyruvyl transferase family protein [Betaproteobacteria bacterium]|nr:polysaccharide pyruvyl transferase family protein [Betaproteobacteria bacterium]
MDTRAPVVLFGAFDRHNLGDLLFPHVLAALLAPRELHFAGLAERDLTAWGGHRVRALASLAAQFGPRPVHLVHAGGELLDCDVWEAAVMLQRPGQAQAVIARYHGRAERFAWAQAWLATPRLAAYVAPRSALARVASLSFVAVGGVELDRRNPAFRAEILGALYSADFLTVRERITQDTLRRAGLRAGLLPDPAVTVGALFGTQIEAAARAGEVAEVRRRFPRGYLAVQFAAEFGDDRTLATLAAQLDQVARETGLGTVLFRAGAAPWHDDPDCLRRIAARMATPGALFESLHVFDICALLARARAFCGSSLHGRIVAHAFAVPGVTVFTPSVAQRARLTKHVAWLGTWCDAPDKRAVAAEGIAGAVAAALAADRERLAASAADMARRFARELRPLQRLLEAQIPPAG